MDFQELISLTAIHDGHDLAMREYSGRGMMGRNCLAISGEANEIRDLFVDATARQITMAVDMLEENQDQALAEFKSIEENVARMLSYRSESLGRGIVYYWPDIEFIKPEDVEDEEEPE